MKPQKSTFKAALEQCGLSNRAAAQFFNVSVDTVDSWSRNRNPVPDGVWIELAALDDSIWEAVDYHSERLKGEPVDSKALLNCTVQVLGAPECVEVAAGARLMLARVFEQAQEEE